MAAATGLVPHVDVEITLTDMQTPAGEALLRLPTVASNVVTVADAITGLTDVNSYGDIANSFNGYIWIDDIEGLGPALKR